MQRVSRALEQFFAYVRDERGLSILDLGGVNQENVSYITNLGHKLYSTDYLRNLDATLKTVTSPETLHPAEMEGFLQQILDYPDDFFDGVLMWDALTFAEARLANATVERLSRIVKPRSYLLALFHAPERSQSVPVYSFRIQGPSTLLVAARGEAKPAQVFNNRNVEKLFQSFESVKFFLTRDSLREVIVRR
ncbi:MAG: hypothetical protein IPM24_11490 [Bryobacterales bacterium]|nr:hypothetical protein [Bryobacterales bacterium]